MYRFECIPNSLTAFWTRGDRGAGSICGKQASRIHLCFDPPPGPKRKFWGELVGDFYLRSAKLLPSCFTRSLSALHAYTSRLISATSNAVSSLESIRFFRTQGYYIVKEVAIFMSREVSGLVTAVSNASTPGTTGPGEGR